MPEPTWQPSSFFEQTEPFTFGRVRHRPDPTGLRCNTAKTLVDQFGRLPYEEYGRSCGACFGPEHQYPDGQFKPEEPPF